MLEIAFEIMSCLVLVAIIALALGYIIAKNKSDKEKVLEANKVDLLIDKMIEENTLIKTDLEAKIEEEKSLNTKILEEKASLKKDLEKKLAEEKSLNAKILEEKALLKKDLETKIEEKVQADKLCEEKLEALRQERLEVESESEEIAIESETIEEVTEALEKIDAQEIEDKDIIKAVEPELLSEARNGLRDDLTKIKGIGPKVQEKLNAFGIYHFDQIASWNEENILWLKENSTFVNGSKDTWIEQAKFFQ